MEATAILRNYPTSPRKMRLIADLIRGQEVHDALVELEFNVKHTSVPMRKLLLSAISNWKQKNNEQETDGLFIKRIFVDEARSLKRMLPAPQGRAYKIKKRSNHVTIVVDKGEVVSKSVVAVAPTQEENPTPKVVVKKKPASATKTEKKPAKKTANQ